MRTISENIVRLWSDLKFPIMETIDNMHDFLIEKKGFFVEVMYDYEYDSTPWHYYIRKINEPQGRLLTDWKHDFKCRHDALEHGILLILENLEKEK